MDFFKNENLDIFFNGIYSDECLIVDQDIKIRGLFDFVTTEEFNVYNTACIVDLKKEDVEKYLIQEDTLLKINNEFYVVKELRDDYKNVITCTLEKQI